MYATTDFVSAIFPNSLSGPGGVLFPIVLLIVSLALMFYGRHIIKALAFLVTGLAGAAFGLVGGAVVLGPLGAVIGAIIGFIIGGVIGLFLVHVGMGLALGYFGYLITRDLTHVFLLAALVGVILFFIGVVISTKLLELVTAILGGVILYGVLTFFGVPPVYAGLISLVLAVAGFFVQRQVKRYRSNRWGGRPYYGGGSSGGTGSGPSWFGSNFSLVQVQPTCSESSS
jgi:hypothetical protein